MEKQGSVDSWGLPAAEAAEPAVAEPASEDAVEEDELFDPKMFTADVTWDRLLRFQKVSSIIEVCKKINPRQGSDIIDIARAMSPVGA